MAYSKYYGFNSGIPALGSYKEALDWWTNTKPIKGRKEDVRPLGKRNRVDEYQIRKLDDGTIECVLWQDPCVIFTPDNRIGISNPFTGSQGVANFVSQVMPNRIDANIFDHDLVITSYGKEGAGHYYMQQRTPKVERASSGKREYMYLDENYHFLSPKPEMSFKINRAKLKEKREQFKEFTDYARNYIKVHGISFELHEINKYSRDFGSLDELDRRWGKGDAVEALTSFYKFITEKGDKQYDYYLNAFYMLAEAVNGTYDFSTSTKRISYEVFEREFDYILKGLFLHEVYDAKPREDNKVVRNKCRLYCDARWAEGRKALGLNG